MKKDEIKRKEREKKTYTKRIWRENTHGREEKGETEKEVKMGG